MLYSSPPSVQFTAPCGKAAARILGVKPGSWLSARVQLLIGFAASGASHMPADYMAAPMWVGMSMPFFIWQAVGITIEDFVIKLAASQGIKQSGWTRMLGYIWTWPIWFTFTIPVFIGWMLPAGIAQGNMFNFSVVLPALEYFYASTGINYADYIVPELRYIQ